MAKRKTHPDVEYAVEDSRGNKKMFRSFDEAAAFAVTLAAAGRPSYLDVLVYSELGARHYMGETGVEIYEEDPDASVFERWLIRADSEGRIP